MTTEETLKQIHVLKIEMNIKTQSAFEMDKITRRAIKKSFIYNCWTCLLCFFSQVSLYLFSRWHHFPEGLQALFATLALFAASMLIKNLVAVKHRSKEDKLMQQKWEQINENNPFDEQIN